MSENETDQNAPPMAPQTAPLATPKKRWPKILLAASLSLNLLIIGMATGMALKVRNAGTDGAPDRFGAVAVAMVRALERDDRARLRERFNEDIAVRRAEARGRENPAGPIISALRAVPFDPEALAEVLNRQRPEFEARHRVGQDMILERLTSMTNAARGQYADRLQDILEHRREHMNRP